MADDEDRTRVTLEQALSAHVAASTGGGFLTDWVLTAAAADPTDDGVTHYVTESSDGSPHRRLGLVHRLRIRAESMWMEPE